MKNACVASTEASVVGGELAPSDSSNEPITAGELVDRARIETMPSSPFVAEVVTARHPTLAARVLARWTTARGEQQERWLACLHGLPVRERDRVLVTRPSNWFEPIVTGVLDGFAERPEPERGGPTLTLLSDERLRVVDASGAPIVEVIPSDDGPIVRFLRLDVNIETQGKLRLAARDIEIVAKEGAVRVEARDNVVVQGETIHLN